MSSRPVADQRVIRGAALTVSHQFTDADGEPAAPAGTVTVGIVDALGNVVVAAGTATSGSTTAPRTYSLTAATTATQLGFLTVTWTDSSIAVATSLVEIVGGYYFTAAEFTAWLGGSCPWSTPQVVLARRIAEETCELATGVSWVPRRTVARLNGTGTTVLILPDPMVRAVIEARNYYGSTNYATFPVTNVATNANANVAEDATIGVAYLADYTLWPPGYQNIVINYDHGYDRPTQAIKNAVMKHTRQILLDGLAPATDNADRYQTGDGTLIFRAIPAGTRTGIPDVDAVYERNSMLIPGIG